MNKEELINLIAKENNMLIGKDDPILMLVTANDFLIKKFELSLSNMLSENSEKITLELYKYNESVKQISEKILNASLTASKKTLTNHIEESASEVKKIIKNEILAAKIEMNNERKEINFYSKISLILIIINIFLIIIFFCR